ncbi:MAG: toxin-antitoxin system TumE family protein [Nevskiales bacterium]
MKAELLLKDRHALPGNAFAELVVWRVPVPISGCRHLYKYRLALVVDGVCVLRYDNETGKGDHRHVGRLEYDYQFSDPVRLVSDFHQDVMRWLHENRKD